MTEEQRNATAQRNILLDVTDKVKQAFVDGYEAGALDHSLGVYDVDNAWLQMMQLWAADEAERG